MHKSSSKEEFSARIKNWTDIEQSIFTVAAIIAGLIWFFMQRSDKPQIKLEHSVSQRVLAGEDGTLLIAVDIRVTNIGKVKVTLDKGVLRIYQVNPIPGEELVREGRDPKGNSLQNFALNSIGSNIRRSSLPCDNSSAMNIFISWSGEKSHAAAKALAE